MSNAFTLDDLNKAIDAKYAPFNFHAGADKYVLRQVLRLSKSERESVVLQLKHLETFQDAEVDEDAILQTIETIVSLVTDDGRGPKLIELLGHDLVRVQMLMEMWMEASQTGEASPSPA